MNADNYRYLSSTMRKFGFENTLDQPLRTKMELDMPSFSLKASVAHGKESMIHELQFDKKGDAGLYFLNGHNVTLVNADQEKISQKLPLFNQKGFNTEEAYNLMKGRSVRNTIRIDGKEQTRWTRIDFESPKNKSDNYVFRNTREDDSNFNLVKEFNKLPVHKLSQEDKETLLNGLRSGNIEFVMLRHEGQVERVSLQTSPAAGSIDVYNSKGEKINLSSGKVKVIDDDVKAAISDMTKDLIQKGEEQGMKSTLKPKK